MFLFHLEISVFHMNLYVLNDFNQIATPLINIQHKISHVQTHVFFKKSIMTAFQC